MRVFERLFEKQLRNVVKLNKMHMRFMLEKELTVDAIFMLRQLLEKYDMAGRKLYIISIDLEKAFDRIPRKISWLALRKKSVAERGVLALKEMYKNIEISVKIDYERSSEFEVEERVHQNSVFSHFLFAHEHG